MREHIHKYVRTVKKGGQGTAGWEKLEKREVRAKGRREKNGVEGRAPYAQPPWDQCTFRVHRPGECSRASSMHLRMQPEPRFILINPFSSASRHNSLPVSHLAQLFSRFLRSSSFHPLRAMCIVLFLPTSPVALHYCSFSPFPKAAPFSQYVSPFALHPWYVVSIFHQQSSVRLSLFHPLFLSCPTLSLVLATLLLMSLFALLHSGKTLPYPKNNPFRAVYRAIYTYI